MRFIGIDLGTTNTCVATLDAAGRPKIIASRQGESTMPSVVAFPERGAPIVGTPARRQAVTNPHHTIFGAKRLIGRRHDDPEVQRLAATLPYEVAAAPSGDAWVQVGGRLVSPQEVSSHVLSAMRVVAEEHFGDKEINEAIVTVPAYFDHAQRQATKDAAEIAGITVRRLLNEPTAAALGYGAHRNPTARLAVCDLGGGTFDVSIVNVEQGVFEVLSTHGDNLLGGEDFDRRVLVELAREIRTSHAVDIETDAQLLTRLREEVERAKHTLSEAAQAQVQIPYLGASRQGYTRTLARAELESWTADVVARLESPCREALSNARLEPAQIDHVLLVGGATRMPAVQRKIAEIFGRPPARNVNPDEIVAIGAATQCALLAGQLEGVVLLDVTSRTLGFHAGGGRFLPVIPRNATAPTREHKILPTTEDGQREVTVEIYEGEAVDISGNRHLGTFVLGGLPDAPAGEVMVLLELTVDVDGLLSVTGREMTSGVRAEVRLATASGLSRADVRRLRAAAMR
jgi:molecular chaperone DnaK